MSAFLNSGRPLARVRFGSYELQPDAHVLRKRGISIRLQEQPWQVLCALLEKPGEVVTREELNRLWPEGTFVDFDQSLNKAVNKLRHALSDTAGEPRYVETLARRGYRFVANVEEVAAPPVSVAVLPAAFQAEALALDSRCGRPSGCYSLHGFMAAVSASRSGDAADRRRTRQARRAGRGRGQNLLFCWRVGKRRQQGGTLVGARGWRRGETRDDALRRDGSKHGHLGRNTTRQRLFLACFQDSTRLICG